MPEQGTTIRLREHRIEVPDPQFLSMIQGMVSNALMIAGTITQDHSLGNINRSGTKSRRLLWSDDEVTQSVLRAARDRKLSGLLDRLGEAANALVSHDQLITGWVYGYFQIPFDLDPVNLARFSRRMSRERRKAADARTGLLSWVSDKEYQDLVKQSRKLVDEMGRVVAKIVVRISELRASM